MKKIMLVVVLSTIFCSMSCVDRENNPYLFGGFIILVTAVVVQEVINIQQKINYYKKNNEFLDKQKLHSREVENQRLLKIFENLKKELSVPDNVQLRFVDMKAVSTEKDTSFIWTAYFNSDSNIIYLSRDYYSSIFFIRNPELIGTLVHELEHVRQFAKCSGSYHGKNSWQKEQGADAATAGYFNCWVCLCENAKALGLTERGYFGEDDYNSYIARAKEENKLCIDHKNCNIDFNNKSDFLLKGSWLTSMGVITYYWKKFIGTTPYKNRFTKYGSKFFAANAISFIGICSMHKVAESYRENVAIKNTNTAILQDVIEELKENKEKAEKEYSASIVSKVFPFKLAYKLRNPLTPTNDSRIVTIERELKERSSREL